jgi:hypothetical protein
MILTVPRYPRLRRLEDVKETSPTRPGPKAAIIVGRVCGTVIGVRAAVPASGYLLSDVTGNGTLRAGVRRPRWAAGEVNASFDVVPRWR